MSVIFIVLLLLLLLVATNNFNFNFFETKTDDIDVHLACTTIKLFLRNLPKPLIPNDVNDALFGKITKIIL